MLISLPLSDGPNPDPTLRLVFPCRSPSKKKNTTVLFRHRPETVVNSLTMYIILKYHDRWWLGGGGFHYIFDHFNLITDIKSNNITWLWIKNQNFYIIPTHSTIIITPFDPFSLHLWDDKVNFLNNSEIKFYFMKNFKIVWYKSCHYDSSRRVLVLITHSSHSSLWT